MIEILEHTSPQDLADLRRDCLASYGAPQDGMWEAFTAMSHHREILSARGRAGYFCVNEEGSLLQFYLAPPFENLATEIFSAIVSRDEVLGAMVSTADPLFLGLCLDRQEEVHVHTRLYQDHRRGESRLEEGAETSFDVVEPGELETIAALQRQSLDQDLGDWLVEYLENLIARGELYALRIGGEIVATGEARVSDTQPPFADLGVITMRAHRRGGLASHVLVRLKQRCYDRELVPICSTTVDNVAAQRAIVTAGFVSRHRLLQVAFRESG